MVPDAYVFHALLQGENLVDTFAEDFFSTKDSAVLFHNAGQFLTQHADGQALFSIIPTSQSLQCRLQHVVMQWPVIAVLAKELNDLVTGGTSKDDNVKQ